MPSIITRVTSAQDATINSGPLSNTQIDSNFINLNNAIILSQDVTGFADRSSSTISFDETTRILTLSPTGANFTIYYRGKAVLIDAPKTITIANSSGGHYIYWDTALNRLADAGATPNTQTILVAYIYYDASSTKAIIFGDERHSVSRDTTWHNHQHTLTGAIWKSGGDATYTVNNTNQVIFALSSPVILVDEDLEHNITHSDAPFVNYEQNISGTTGVAGAVLPVLYLSGSTYKQSTATNVPWYPSTTRAYYNQITAGSGSLVTASDNGLYVTYWCVATNDVKYPIKLVMGRNTYSTYAEAETENFDSYGLPMPEIAPMYKIILQTSDAYTQNQARIRIVAVRELLGKQNARSNSFDTLTHEALSDRFTPNQHTISSITDLQTTLDGIAGSAIAMSIALG